VLAPTLVVEGLGRGTVALDGPWQFHLGDDLTWADPAFDDSGWEQLSANKPWGMQGHANTEGMAWYRLRVALDPGQRAPQTLSILLTTISISDRSSSILDRRNRALWLCAYGRRPLFPSILACREAFMYPPW
jgi:hypothetical protein